MGTAGQFDNRYRMARSSNQPDDQPVSALDRDRSRAPSTELADEPGKFLSPCSTTVEGWRVPRIVEISRRTIR